MTQTALAGVLEISPSYLNLIERNKRRLPAPLMRRVADALNLSADDLEGAGEERLAGALTEIAYQPALSGLEIEADRAPELIGRFPGWARALSALARSEHDARNRADALSDRLTHDPFVGETLHRMLTRIAAIRSAAEILVDFDDIPDDQRTRFQNIISDEAGALTETGEALATLFEKSRTAERRLTPLDEVEALLDTRNNHFAELEDAETDPATQAARIDDVLAQTTEIETVAARNRAKRTLEAYADGVAALPMPAFTDRAAALGYDAEALAHEFDAPVDMVCRRLTAMPLAPGRPRFGYIQANASGIIVQLRNLPRLAVPRYAGVCRQWVLHRAPEQPEVMLRQHALLPTGDRFVFAARARNTAPPGFGRQRLYVTDMLTLSEADAALTVYAPTDAAPEEVGASSRTCTCAYCAQQAADPLAG